MIKNHSGMFRDVIFHRSKSKNQQEMNNKSNIMLSYETIMTACVKRQYDKSFDKHRDGALTAMLRQAALCVAMQTTTSTKDACSKVKK